MGHVWVAEHRTLGTEVAVKFLGDDFMKNESIRGRFSREAAAAAQVKSSHAVKVYDHGVTESEVPFIVMELLEGVDLGTRIRTDHKLPPPFVAKIVTQLCKALQSAHDASVIHRDVKPDNIFLSNEDGDVFVKLLDFGVAKSDKVSEITLKRSTMAGESLGTPYYMSPEQYKSSKETDCRSDLWSVGVVVYEALTGVVPFDAENLTSLAIIVNEGHAKPPTELDPSLPPGIDAWFAKACARKPADRFQSARELSDALHEALSLEVTPRTSIADTSARIILAQQTGDSDQDLSLRETAFASTGTHQRKRSVSLILAVVLGIGTIGVAAFFVMRTPTPKQSVAQTATASDMKVDPTAVVSAPPLPVSSAIEQPPIASAIKPAIAIKTEIKKPAATASATASTSVPSPSASAKPTHEQIW